MLGDAIASKNIILGKPLLPILDEFSVYLNACVCFRACVCVCVCGCVLGGVGGGT